MNSNEQRIREFAHDIWESEGCPDGQEYRHWEMACKLAEATVSAYPAEKVTGHIMSMIAPEEPAKPDPKPEIEPAKPDPKPEIDPAPPQPEQPAKPNVPAEPIAPVEDPPHISPTPQHEPIHPTDPVQPGNPAQPIQPYASKRTATAKRAAIAATGTDPMLAAKVPKPRKPRATKNQDSINL